MNTKKIFHGFLDMLVRQQHTHAVTFKPNPHGRGWSMESLHRAFWKTHMLIDRALLGSRFNLPSRAHMRTQAFGIVEGLPDCGHLHGSFKVHPAHWAKFEGLFADGGTRGARGGIWRKLVPHGTATVVPIYEPEGWYDYTFKEAWMGTDTDNIVFAPMPVIAPAPGRLRGSPLLPARARGAGIKNENHPLTKVGNEKLCLKENMNAIQ